MSADAPATATVPYVDILREFRGRHQLPQCIEDHLELLVVPLFQSIQLAGELRLFVDPSVAAGRTSA